MPRTRGVGGVVSGAPVLTDNPLLLAGLALAGVNTLSRTSQANGILNAEEIAGLNLQGTGMGCPLGVRYGTRSDHRGRRRVRTAPRAPDRRRAHDHHEPVVG